MPRITKNDLIAEITVLKLSIKDLQQERDLLKAEFKGTQFVMNHINTMSMNCQRLGDALCHTTEALAHTLNDVKKYERK